MVSNNKTKLRGMNDRKKENLLESIGHASNLAKRRQMNYHERRNP